MEALLSLAFDNLSSYDGPKVRKGLRQVEGLLAQICLSQQTNTSPTTDPPSAAQMPRHNRQTSTATTDSAGSLSNASGSKKEGLVDLGADLAFQEFFKLQEGFEWNVALRLINTLDRLMGKGDDGGNDLLILSSLDLIQGVLLLHPPSKALFAREQHMNLLLDLLEPVNCPAIQSATLLTLVVALIDTPFNTRTFEALDGLLTVTSLFKSRSTSREVKLKLVEFLYFYLMPETLANERARSRASSIPRSGSPVKSGSLGSFPSSEGTCVDEDPETLTTMEKQELLGRYLSNVEDLVKDLRVCTPFGGVC